MKNILIEGHEAEDIQNQVAKILRGLGNPEPPLSLEEVRELLDLDRKYYSGTDHGAIREVVSRVLIAGKQIVKRPMLLFDVIAKAKLSALWLPDKKRILIDESRPVLKHRWSEAHEIGHSIISWHEHLLFGDNEYSLNPACHAQMEAEANYAAGQMLFLQGRFADEARDHPVCLKTVKALKSTFGNTFTSTLWRYVEEASAGKPLVGIVSEHPRHLSDDFDPAHPCRYCIQSPEFKRRFAGVSERALFRIIQNYCGFQVGGPLGEHVAILRDGNNDPHIFHFESFSNTYEVLTLGRYVSAYRILARAC
jgi:hypothetical protein